ncbi:UPF0481 protein At3g47200 isoform X1 [Arachis duranensis]|uniref:UPF0481 protein At3g47200 isoform X1 n=1 Tax=Arachis duranensis TaxID=130453 RepID=A0A9C6WN15_ARADU|nr:UPF0481 protein At3g47200 isoform X1 [Arachis duranensis]
MNRYMENHVAKELEAMLKKAQPLFTTKSCCIYKVPHEIRQSNEDAYTPGLVSIGPLHYGNYRLVTMESHKQVYCQHFIQRSEASLSDLVSCVQQLEPHIRACYSEKINLTVDKLVKVIFIDCCFVIELFLRDEWMRNDAIFSKPWMWVRVIYDLLLLENQVPFFVFEMLYNLAFASRLNNGGKFSPFLRLAVGMFSKVEKQGVLTLETSRIAHFTDLLRYLYLTPFHTTTPRERGQLVLGHGASELFKAGVKFQVNKSNHDCILDLEFEHGVLKIPHILVHDKTEVRLRNIVALEQCHYPRHHYLTDYVNFLAQLVNSNKDVDVLINAGIIESTIIGNDTSVNKIFSDVGKNILMENYNANYLQICHGLNAYYKHPWHTKMATLRRDYFTTPWKTVTFIAGIALLLLILLIQTVCSILQV